jgi:hypothetical protein
MPSELDTLLPDIRKTCLAHPTGRLLVWDSWRLYDDPAMLHRAVHALSDMVGSAFGLDFDTIMACGWADPMVFSALVAQHMQKPWTAYLPERARQREWAPRTPRKKRAVIVDHVVNFGSHLEFTLDDLHRFDGEFVGLAVLLDNDTVADRAPSVQRCKDQGKMLALLKASDIVSGEQRLVLEEEFPHPDSPYESGHWNGYEELSLPEDT